MGIRLGVGRLQCWGVRLGSLLASLFLSTCPPLGIPTDAASDRVSDLGFLRGAPCRDTGALCAGC